MNNNWLCQFVDLLCTSVNMFHLHIVMLNLFKEDILEGIMIEITVLTGHDDRLSPHCLQLPGRT
jgi:hypothetical protein